MSSGSTCYRTLLRLFKILFADLDIIKAPCISRMRVPVTSKIIKYSNNRRSHDIRHKTDSSIYHLTLVLTFHKNVKQKLIHF